MLTKLTVSGVTIELIVGDITDQAEFETVVNAANAELMPGGGVAGAIHRVAGPGLAEECRPLAPIRPGASVITAGHGLPNPWVIHTLGPIYGVDEPAEELLSSCYRSSLELAEQHALSAVAFPAISTGAFGYPMDAAAEVALGAVIGRAPKLEAVDRVRFVLWGVAGLEAHGTALESLASRNR